MRRPAGPPSDLPSARRPGPTVRVRRLAVTPDGVREQTDHLVTEEPLEIRVIHRDADAAVAVTMRTPGSDFELAAGFLLSEGVIHAPDDLRAISYCASRPDDQHYNVVSVELSPDLDFDAASLTRNVYTSSSCGICGKASLEAVRVAGLGPVVPGPVLEASVVRALPGRLREAQALFERTGGLHAAGLFSPDGDPLVVREDVGRHNAVDKVLGSRLLDGQPPAHGTVLQVSGRASFEIVQKALAGGIGFVSAVSAPSSLAVDAAREFGMTLVGFVRGDTFNVYCGPERIVGAR